MFHFASQIPSCKYNKMIDCMDPGGDLCKRCGWNPAVRAERVQKVRLALLKEESACHDLRQKQTSST